MTSWHEASRPRTPSPEVAVVCAATAARVVVSPSAVAGSGSRLLPSAAPRCPPSGGRCVVRDVYDRLVSHLGRLAPFPEDPGLPRWPQTAASQAPSRENFHFLKLPSLAVLDVLCPEEFWLALQNHLTRSGPSLSADNTFPRPKAIIGSQTRDGQGHTPLLLQVGSCTVPFVPFSDEKRFFLHCWRDCVKLVLLPRAG